MRAALLKITEAVRKYTAEQSLVDDIERGLEERAKEFERPSYANIEPFFTSQHATRADGAPKNVRPGRIGLRLCPGLALSTT